nr:hypothetical protein [Tanacetum cinerariifolium]
MANLPPPDHIADLPEDEPVHPKPAPIILHHEPTQPEEEDIVGIDDEDEMEVDEDDEENGGNDDEDEAKVINPYEEVDPLNRPPPT